MWGIFFAGSHTKHWGGEGDALRKEEIADTGIIPTTQQPKTVLYTVPGPGWYKSIKRV